MNPYEVLGLRRDATAEEIRQAYRILAKTHHPDAGGNPEAFIAITEAYEILSDEAKRAKYDADGTIDTGASAIDPDRRMAIQVIGQMIAQTLQKLTDEPIYIDIVERLKLAAQASASNISNNIAQRKVEVERLRKFAKRFSAKGSNVISGIITAQADAGESQIPLMEKSLQIHEIVVEILGDHSFQADEMQQMIATFSSSATTSPHMHFGGFGGIGPFR